MEGTAREEDRRTELDAVPLPLDHGLLELLALLLELRLSTRKAGGESARPRGIGLRKTPHLFLVEADDDLSLHVVRLDQFRVLLRDRVLLSG